MENLKTNVVVDFFVKKGNGYQRLYLSGDKPVTVPTAFAVDEAGTSKEVTKNMTSFSNGEDIAYVMKPVDRGASFAYASTIPKKGEVLTVTAVTFAKENCLALYRKIKPVEVVHVGGSTYQVLDDTGRYYIVKHIEASKPDKKVFKKTELALLAKWQRSPEVGRECKVTKLYISCNDVDHEEWVTSPFVKVEERGDAWICETEKTRYLIIKEKSSCRLGICTTRPTSGINVPVGYVLNNVNGNPYLATTGNVEVQEIAKEGGFIHITGTTDKDRVPVEYWMLSFGRAI